MPYKGMDPDEVENLARQLHSQASTLDSIRAKLDGLINRMHANWDGADSNRFNDTYNNQYRHQIQTAVQSLERLANAATANANEQRRTSA